MVQSSKRVYLKAYGIGLECSQKNINFSGVGHKLPNTNILRKTLSLEAPYTEHKKCLPDRRYSSEEIESYDA